DTCLACHAEWKVPILAIFKTKHGVRADKRTPFAAGGLQCEACHGPGAKHAETTSKDAINSFKDSSFLPPEQRNKFCLNCHQGSTRTGWHASTHESNNVACSNCHKIHAERDPVLAKATQPEVCYNCHRKERADFNKPSVHPLRFGRITCSECHNPHGTNTATLLAKPTVNQTCYTCHAEKRGPFLWEHQPVTEDCSNCHNPHGSNISPLLKSRTPFLCSECHDGAHNSKAPYGTLTGGSQASPNSTVLPTENAGYRGCMNCHSMVHGSNHPAGALLHR
ncbi:MAG: DmsE family decaheme c-type cytochrome, partial [Sulfuritalea sp.]|nr:DmsE family decaheme c-type cytochrome [Sulfuritalea sp.]